MKLPNTRLTSARQYPGVLQLTEECLLACIQQITECIAVDFDHLSKFFRYVKHLMSLELTIVTGLGFVSSTECVRKRNNCSNHKFRFIYYRQEKQLSRIQPLLETILLLNRVNYHFNIRTFLKIREVTIEWDLIEPCTEPLVNSNVFAVIKHCCFNQEIC